MNSIIKVGNQVLGTAEQASNGRWHAVAGAGPENLGVFAEKQQAIDAVWDHWNGFPIRNKIEEEVGS